MLRQTHQEDAGHVEEECHRRVEHQHAIPGIRHSRPFKLRSLKEDGKEQVDDRPDRRKVVQAHQRIHLHALGTQHDLDHDQPRALADRPRQLNHQPQPRKVNLAQAGQHDARDDDEHVDKGLGVWFQHAPGPRDEQHGHGPPGLEHLDEGDGEVHVHNVGEDEGGGEEEAEGDDGSEEEAAG